MDRAIVGSNFVEMRFVSIRFIGLFAKELGTKKSCEFTLSAIEAYMYVSHITATLYSNRSTREGIV